MAAFAPLATSLGLALPAGLNAYLPLLIVALAARFTQVIRLQPPYDALSSNWAIVVLALLLGIEVFADKVPAVDTVNDLIQTPIRPLAGGLLFVATGNVITGVHPVLGFLVGLLAAGSVHTAKATTRPLVTASTAGIGNPFVSFAEDAAAAAAAILALLAPLLGLGLILVAVAGILWLRGFFRRRGPLIGG